jgi:Xaa-Pro aminopeptidase
MATTTRILSELRNLMRNKAVQAYIIPSSDAHGSEYLSEKDKRRQFITGFTGSAGTAVVTQDNALLWTDGRYFLQASQQLDSNWKLMKDGLEDTPSLSSWLIKNMPPSSIVGIDSTLYEEDLFINLENSLSSLSTIQLKNIEPNLIDIVWSKNRPKLECNELLKVDLSHCGRSLSEKLILIRTQMNEKNAYAIVATSLDEIAWLLNLRSSDIPFGTVFFSYCIITNTGLQLFINLNRLTDDIRSYLLNQEANIEFFEYESFFSEFQNFYKNEFLNDQIRKTSKIWLCPRSSHMLHSLVDDKYLHKEISYLTKLKIIKNQNEIEASKYVHIKDSAVLCEFWHWIEKLMENYDSLGDDFNEFNVAKYLDTLRMNTSGCLKPSFETICSS